ncbi:MAG: ATP-binding protein [Candidatus Limiplasma sp.]|nr:ATP-binding protein [Candidatus Limiplasma sp.]
MKTKKPISLWLTTVLLSGGLHMLSAIVTGIIAFTTMRFGLVHRTPFLGIMGFLMISTFIGLFFSTFFSKRFLRPLTLLIKATQEIADGNFDVHVETKGRSEINELIQTFNFMARQLSRTEMLRSDFVNNISHEIKTPVAAIENCATMLQSGALDETEQREYAGMIAENARRLSSLSRNILNLSRLENQEIVTERRKFRLDEQIRQAVVLLESKWSAKKLVLDIDLPETIYEGSSELLIQVWINLLDNAIKFSPPEGLLSIHLLPAEDEIRVVIRDQGAGMSPEVAERIFEKFYQGDPAHTTEGNGLGLALAKRIVDLSHGRIEVESKPHEGSSFTVIMPT